MIFPPLPSPGQKVMTNISRTPLIYNCGVQIRPVEYKTDQTVVLNDQTHLSQTYHEITVIYLKEYNRRPVE